MPLGIDLKVLNYDSREPVYTQVYLVCLQQCIPGSKVDS